MWGSSEEPPGTMEAGPPPIESVANLKETCEQSKNQLESVKDIMLKNKESLKKKEEELQEYAKKLSKFKTRAKRSNRSNRDDGTSSSESTPKSKSDATTTPDTTLDVVDDISQAKTPIAKSSLLQKKLAEDRKIFEQRSKEMTESKRAVEEKVEALRQQLEEKYVAPVSVVTPVLVTSQTAHPVIELSHVQDKDHKIIELSNKIFELEATIIDLQENLKEKDSVIDSKTKAVTLMSADLSKKGKTTLDTLEDTKDEMRSMQENFVLVEESLRSKNDNLLKQLEEKACQISGLEESVQSLTDQLEAQKQAEVVSADFSRSTMDTLADTKDAMKSMQENFVLIETSLKEKNDHLLKQLEEREIKLAEAEAKILHLESGLGIERQPNVDDLAYKIDKLEEENRNLQDEKYELQKNISELQNQIVANEPVNNDALLAEKDNKIAELESIVEELKKFHQHQEEQYKAELQKQIDELNSKNEAMAGKVIELEKQVGELENENGELTTKLAAAESEAPKEHDQVQKLTKELDELNKSMIKLKAQHKNKLKNLQKQLKNFEKVSDTNAELVKLANQVTLLEEEKGNLQLSLVDFDELKASSSEWQERIGDLEGKVLAQAKEIEAHIEAIAILENQKLDLMQELHAAKQEVSSLEAENAESENLRVTAEMKVVDLEEQLETLQKQKSPEEPETEEDGEEDLQRQLESLKEENERLSQKILKLEELKASSDVGSTESFVKTGSNVDSTESFEALNADAERADLLRKIDGLTRENGALLEKLSRFEEKGSSDAGSTESFERIPEQGEPGKLEATHPEEVHEHVREPRSLLVDEARPDDVQLAEVDSTPGPTDAAATDADSTSVEELLAKICKLQALNENLTSSLQELEKEKSELVAKLTEEKPEEQKAEEDKEKDAVVKAEELVAEAEGESPVESSALVEKESCGADDEDKSPSETELAAVAALESEIARCNGLIAEQKDAIEDLRTKLAEKEAELERRSAQMASDSEACNLDVASLRRELEDSASSITEWKARCAETEAKLESLEQGKQQIEQGLQALQDERKSLLEESERKDALLGSLKEELDATLANLEVKTREQADNEELVRELRTSLESKEQELRDKYAQLQSDLVKIDELQEEMSKLEGKLQQRDATVASMTEELETLRMNFSLATEDLQEAWHQQSNLQKQLNSRKSAEEYEKVIEDLNHSQLLLDEMVSKNSQKLAEIEQLKSQTEALIAENEQLRRQLEEEERGAAELLENNRSQEEALRNAERAKAEVDNRLMELQSLHDEHERQLRSNSEELRDAYKLMEQLKIKHTEDIEMLNRRLEDSLEELQLKAQEAASLQSELDQKSSLVAASVSEEVKSALEARVAELEKKLAEADEKCQGQLEKMKKYAAVAKKKTAQVEELEAKVSELEEKYSLEKNEKDARNSELQQSVAHIQEKDNRLTALEEELNRAQAERDEARRDAEATKAELDELSQKLNVLQNELQELNEVKERARELGVRMEVMEKEYVEQLAEINSLKTDNGLLLSKQAQINERLENVEKESEERRALLEKLEKEKEIEETRKSESHEICRQCASRVQALEAKLQERDAEIENLDNELHNSIGNLVQMQESLRLSTIPAAADNALTDANEELRSNYETALRENRELSERLVQLEAELHGQIERLTQDNQNLARECEQLKSAQQNPIVDEGWGIEPTLSAFDVEAVALPQHEPLVNEPPAERPKREAVADEEDSPPLFDASVFGAPPPAAQTANAELELEVGRLREEASSLNKQLEEARLAAETAQVHLNGEIQQARATVELLTSKLDSLSAARDELESALMSKDAELSALRNELGAANEALAAARSDYEKLSEELEHKNAWIISATSEREAHLGQLEHLSLEKQDIERVVGNLLFGTSGVDESLSIAQKLQSFEIKHGELLSELEAAKSENQELLAAQEVHRNKIVQLEMEAKACGGDSALISELEARVARVVGERDILQLQVNDVTRAYEELKESSEALRSSQSQLEAVSQERNQLLREIEALRVNQPTEHKVEKREAQEQAATPKLGDLPMSESMWEDDEDPWGFNDLGKSSSGATAAEQHVDIPIVPSMEIQLRLKVDELEEQLKELTDENAKLIEEGKLAQVKNVKYVKKLKEYKVQFDSLQRELKSQRSIGGFGDLDSAIEDELKAQVASLEKALAEAKEDTKKALADREGLLKRIDVLTAATERFTEAKERQDVEVHVWQMRYKELEAKLQQFDFGPETRDSTTSPAQQSSIDASSSSVHELEAKVKDLEQELNSLAAENEELQHLLEEHRDKRQAAAKESEEQAQELRASNEKLKTEYETLRKQYEQSLMDANDQVQSMRQNSELLKAEFEEKSAELSGQLIAAQEAKAQLEARSEELERSLASASAELQQVREHAEALAATAAASQQQSSDELAEKESRLAELAATLAARENDLAELRAASEELRRALENKVNGLELSIEGYVTELQEKNERIDELQAKLANFEAALGEKEQQMSSQSSQLEQCASEVRDQHELAGKLAEAERRIDELNAVDAERETKLERSFQEIDQLRFELQSKVSELEELKSELESLTAQEQPSVGERHPRDVGEVVEQEVVAAIAAPVEEEVPVFTFGSDGDNDRELKNLKAQLKAKDGEIEHLLHSLNEAKTTRMIQELQDNVNALYNEKSYLEEQIIVKNQEIHALKTQLDGRPAQQPVHDRRKRSLGDQEEIIKLQNELHARDQQINDLRYVLAEKEAQLKLALPAADEMESKAHELYENFQKIESYKLTVDELQAEVASLRGLERLAAEDKATIERLSSEKETVRLEAEEAVQRILQEKEAEIDGIKTQLMEENQRLMNDLGLRERDLENLRQQLHDLSESRDNMIEHEVSRLHEEIAERDRRLAELSITKDAEIHNMRLQLSEKNAKVEELIAMSEEEQRQLADLRQLLEMREQQINGLMQQLEEKTKEYELIHNALQRHVAKSDEAQQQQQLQMQGSSEAAAAAAAAAPAETERELDLALYMLHQRDVRCEELALELTQLVDERDTLQLRLSNALRNNEELKKYADSSLQRDPLLQEPSTSHVEAEPLIENPSPSKSEGPVEIAKEAIGEDKKVLAQKLSELRSVDQRRDVRLKDDREQRHTQQMRLMAHKDVLSKLPAEAAARLVNANYTLSRNVQSQSSVLMNWLWGKSTPKVMHM